MMYTSCVSVCVCQYVCGFIKRGLFSLLVISLKIAFIDNVLLNIFVAF